jgi:hypothetical protein
MSSLDGPFFVFRKIVFCDKKWWGSLFCKQKQEKERKRDDHQMTTNGHLLFFAL